jgi:hypothetical protein
MRMEGPRGEREALRRVLQRVAKGRLGEEAGPKYSMALGISMEKEEKEGGMGGESRVEEREMERVSAAECRGRRRRRRRRRRRSIVKYKSACTE